MKSSIDIDDFARREREMALDNGGNGSADILRLTPTTEWCESLANHEVILFSYRGGHICLDNSWTDLKYRNSEFRQSAGVELSHHRKPCFGNTVVCPVCGGRVG